MSIINNTDCNEPNSPKTQTAEDINDRQNVQTVTVLQGDWECCVTLAYCVVTCRTVCCRAFPRRYAKTHAWGTSLMDVGVGGVVLAGGLVSGGSGGWRRRYSNRSPL